MGADVPVSWSQRVLTWAKELGIIVASALVLSLIIKTFFFQSFWIPSSSMETTLDVGDRILVTKWRPEPLELRRGDIIVFKDPGNWLGTPALPADQLPGWADGFLTFTGLLPEDAGEHLVKRVVGLPGDVVVCCDADGFITINGERLVEPYLDAGVEPSMSEFTTEPIPEGYVWVMGDNRPGSGDSRFHRAEPGGGAIPIDNIVGVVFATVWPLNHWTGHGNPFPEDGS